jgi:hypothetical protein
MNVLLIRPVSIKKLRYAAIPLGIGYAAAVWGKNGSEVAVIDG